MVVSIPSTEQLLARFEQLFGHPSSCRNMAPGRVNLIGEHTDYNDGFVLPAAIDYATWALGAPRQDRRIRAVALDFDQQEVSFSLDEPMQTSSDAPWSDYLRGVVQALLARGYRLCGADLLISGNVPRGAGLSSSASLEMALVRSLTDLGGEAIDPVLAARLGQMAENDFVGCNCGIMDQLVSAAGQQGHALLIDCRDLSTQAVPIPPAWRLLIVESGVTRGLVDSEYNLRREQCEAAAAHFGQSSLRDVSLRQLDSAQSELDPELFRRARHVLTENERTLAACDALRRADLSALVDAMSASHRSMRDDFEITTPAIDTLVSILDRAGEGEAGVRMTGGGFGGCVVAVAPESRLPALMSAVEAEYTQATGCQARLIPAQASAGAFADRIK